MGFLSSVFGERKGAHPPLDRESVAGRRVAQRQLELEAFARKVKDRIEIVPAQDVTYVFVGKPPGSFGIAWIAAGRELSLKTLMQERGLSAGDAQLVSDQLREVYRAHLSEDRFQADLAGHAVTVTPSEALAADVRRIIDAVAA